MSDEMPWVLGLTDKEVEELRNKKHTLTQYGKQKLNEMMNRIPDNDEIEDIMNITLTEEKKAELDEMRNSPAYPDEMFEEAERREKSNRVLQRYNDYYNLECSGLPHGTPITPEHQQALALDCMVAAIRCEYMNQEFDRVPVSDIEDLIEALYQQGKDYLKRVQEFKDSADGVA